jgi:hypothetical protein
MVGQIKGTAERLPLMQRSCSDRRSPRRGAHVDRPTRPKPRPTPAFDAALESAAGVRLDALLMTTAAYKAGCILHEK